MSHFSELNLTEFSVHQPGFLKILPTEEMEHPTDRNFNVCVCCLTINGPFVKLGTCAHSEFVENICCDASDIDMMAVCRLCHGMLLKINMFKKQVEESLRRLCEQAENLNKGVISEVQSNRQINNMQHSMKQPFFVLNSIDIEIKVEPDVLAAEYAENVAESVIFPAEILKNESLFDEKTQAKLPGIIQENLLPSVDLKERPSIKTEYDIEEIDSDLETSVPLSEVKKEMNAKRLKDNVASRVNNYDYGYETSQPMYKDMTEQQMWLLTRTKSAQIEEKYKGKIREVILTLGEVMAEREAGLGRLKLPYKCLDCVKEFEFELNLQEHNKKLHTYKKGYFQCEICKKCFELDMTNRTHYIRHYTRYACEKCDIRYNTLNAVFAHYNSTHGESSGDVISTVQTCKDCNMTFPNNRKYRYHLSKHKGRAQCEECDKTFINNSGLKKHVLLVHKEVSRGYKCEPCGKSYKEKNGLRAHIKSHHSDGDSAAYCDTCDRLFKTEHNLKNHLRTHSAHVKDDDKKFVCAECGERFLARRFLDQHVNWTHLKKSEFHCTICDKPFKSKNGLKNHKRFVHDKETPPKNKICDYCGRGFACYGTLKAHIRRHTGERPLKCEFCDATFAHQGALYTHKKLVHKVLPKKRVT